MVVNALDWINMPAVIGTDLAEPAKVFQNRLISKLPAAMDELAQQLNVKISVFDFIAALGQIQRNASQYGITNLIDPCVSEKGVCVKPDEYYWWTGIYLTRRVHQLLGQAMAEQISKKY
jgi:cholinesterase